MAQVAEEENMFSLPNIVKMNKSAKREADFYRRMPADRLVRCGFCEREVPRGEAEIEAFYDSLSPGKKGHVITCQECRDEGKPEDGESYFRCVGCDKLHVVNYSWEIYMKESGDGPMCIPCYRESVLGIGENWLRTAEEIRALVPAQVHHLGCIGNEYPMPKGVKSFRAVGEYEREGYDFYSRMDGGGWGGDPTAEMRACALAAFRFYGEVHVACMEAGQFQAYADVLVKLASRRKVPLDVFPEEIAIGLREHEQAA